jgi:geranylgeranyl pyrophosphate synthase
MAAACVPQATSRLQESLAEFASTLALAFRMRCDLLQPPGDPESARPSYPVAVGAEATRERLERLYAQALEALRPLESSGEPLRELAQWLLSDRPRELRLT